MMRSTLDHIIASPWLMLLGVVIAGLIAGRLLVALLRPALARAARHSSWQWDDLLIAAISAPLSTLIAVRAMHATLPWLPLDSRANALASTLTAVVTTALVLWCAFRAVDVVVAVLSRRSWAVERPATGSLLQIAGRLAKVVVVVLALIVVLAHLGVSVASLVAGLGIGGLAIALAAQKTVENLFGTLSIGVDQPLREGDFVRVSDFVGTVEAIGLRSTRIRTLDRTIVTVPNGQLADQQIESFSVRDRIRLACTLGLVYDTSVAQMRAVLDGVESVLRAHPKIWSEAVVVRFKELGESSLDIEVMAWFQTSDWTEFQGIRQDVLLQFMEVIEASGTSFAFPTRTIHMTAAPVSEALRSGG